MQQGRVLLDADFNEQSAILLHYLRTLARDLIGPYAAPVENAGFALRPAPKGGGFTITAGRYYVDGILVENSANCTYATQPAYRVAADDPVLKAAEEKTGQTFWAYLDVWERHITSLEDDSIREKALGGPDTCTRSQVVWQVKVREIDRTRGNANQESKIGELEAELARLSEHLPKEGNPGEQEAARRRIAELREEIVKLRKPAALRCETPLADLVRLGGGRLAARVAPRQKEENPCITSPESRYRGAENQLYRVEVHEGGPVGTATFKWSRDNGSRASAWLGTDGNDLEVASTRGFAPGSWVEITDEALDYAGSHGVLVKIVKVEGGRLSVDPASFAGTPDALAWSAARPKPTVRQWDQAQTGDTHLKAGAISFQESGPASDGWIDLEDGIQVRFQAGGEYRTGDYWLIPARVATGNLEWPLGDDDFADFVPPRGIEHHYAPLGFFSWSDKKEWKLQSCGCDFEPLSSCFAAGSAAVGAHLLDKPDHIITPVPVTPASPLKRRQPRKRPNP